MDFVRESEKMNPQIFMEIDEIRRFRNRVIYEWKDVKTEDVLEAIDRIGKIREGLVLE
jgi:uncharacterized protein YutE (UPF0331/DUF86 family)